MHIINDKLVLFLDPLDVEQQAMVQLLNTAELSFVRGVAGMPDVHSGKGAVVGSVIATTNAISPAAVGVDIGCGVIAVLTQFFIPSDFVWTAGVTQQFVPFATYVAGELVVREINCVTLREAMERRIPMGPGEYKKKPSETACPRIGQLEASADSVQKYDTFDRNWRVEIGTLGGGNHFIELCRDEAGRVWVVLHSGSRGIGNKIGTAHIKIAQAIMAEEQIFLKDRDLAYLTEGTKEFTAYIRDLLWAQEFARLSRDEMMDQVMTVVSESFYGSVGHESVIEQDRINCHHNFTAREHHFGEDLWITRKGAIQMKKGQRGIIPGAMNAPTYIVSGLENADAFHSAPHGGGRAMSRTEAKRRFTEEDLRKSMEGIVYRHSSALIDEIGASYKDIAGVIENSRELVTVDNVLKQFVNAKGD